MDSPQRARKLRHGHQVDVLPTFILARDFVQPQPQHSFSSPAMDVSETKPCGSPPEGALPAFAGPPSCLLAAWRAVLVVQPAQGRHHFFV
eukprot:643364-Hanusia_phi.AAC.3